MCCNFQYRFQLHKRQACITLGIPPSTSNVVSIFVRHVLTSTTMTSLLMFLPLTQGDEKARNESALNYIVIAANGGHAGAQTKLGECYALGKYGMEEGNWKEARKWYGGGVVVGCFVVGCCVVGCCMMLCVVMLFGIVLCCLIRLCCFCTV